MALLSGMVGGLTKSAIGTAANAAAEAAKRKTGSSGSSSGGAKSQTAGGVSSAYSPYGSAGKTVQVGSDGKAPAGLKAGDSVKTGGGTYRITGVNADGSYQSQKVAAPAAYGYTDYDGRAHKRGLYRLGGEL